MVSIDKRVELLIKKVANTKASFAQATGISSVILSHISSGRNKVSLTAVEQILKAYPKVNAEWLVLGVGSMFKDGLNHDLTAALSNDLSDLSQEMDKFKETFDKRLKKIIEQLEESS